MNLQTPTLAHPSRSIRAHVWDLADEGLHEVLDRLHEADIDGLHLHVACHGGRYYCPHNPRRLLVHAPEGAIYFRPESVHYEGLRPLIHPQYGSGAVAERAAEALREAQMHFTAAVVLFNNSTLTQSFVNAACVNVFGDRMEGALCPSRPAVRMYARALVEDLAYVLEAQSIELRDFAFPSHEDYIGPRWQGIVIGPGLGYLMSLCFCEDCRKRAEDRNIEMDALTYHVERLMRAGLSGDLSDRRIVEDIADPHNPISRFAEVRAETIASLLAELIGTIGDTPASLQLRLDGDPDGAWRRGIRLHGPRQRNLGVAVSTHGLEPAMATATVARYAELLHIGDNLTADIELSSASDEDLDPRDMMIACEHAGVDRFVFSDYGLSPLHQLDYLAMPARP